MQPTRTQRLPLEYAQTHRLRVQEHEHQYDIEIDKGDIRLEVTLVKDQDVHEWFITAYNATTGEELYSSYWPYIAERGELDKDIRANLDAAAMAVTEALHRSDVRIGKSKPLCRLFGRDILGGPTLQYFNGTVWKEWDDVAYPFS